MLFKKGNKPWNTGKKRAPFSLETRRKMGLSRIGKKMPPFSKEHLENMSKVRLGKKHSPEHSKKISESKIGKKHSLEAREKMSKTHQLRVLNGLNRFWRGGISKETYPNSWRETLRDSIRERDSYLCQKCGISQTELTGKIKKLAVHHIDYDKKNCDPKNLISLCHSCHAKTNSNRDYWTKMFVFLLATKWE